MKKHLQFGAAAALVVCATACTMFVGPVAESPQDALKRQVLVATRTHATAQVALQACIEKGKIKDEATIVLLTELDGRIVDYLNVARKAADNGGLIEAEEALRLMDEDWVAFNKILIAFLIH